MTKLYKKWYVALAISAVIALVALWLNSTDFASQVELRTLDYRFRRFTIPEQADTNVVLVAIDDNSLDFFSKSGVSWPWPRDFYAHVTDYFTSAKAQAVIYDLQFYEPDLDRDETDSEQTDGAFARAIRASGNVVLAATLTHTASHLVPDIRGFSLPVKGKLTSDTQRYVGVNVPIDTLRQAAALGFVNILPDGDGVVRRVPTLYSFRGDYYPQLALAAWLMSRPREPELVLGPDGVKAGTFFIPTDGQGSYLVNWYGPGGTDQVFRAVSFGAVVQSASAAKAGSAPVLPAEFFKGKYVIVGATASGIEDVIPAPFKDPYPGVELWATVLSNLINQHFIVVLPLWLNVGNVVLVAFLTFLVFTRFAPRTSHPILGLVLLYVFGFGIYLWSAHRTVLSLTTPFVGFVLAYLSAATLSYLAEGRSKREIRKVFSRYLHPGVIDSLLEDPAAVTFGGEEVHATVLFTDLYEFTSFSEGKSAPFVVESLNEYFDKLTQIILEHKGLLDKYTGDGVMALFGVPIQCDDHALLACGAALEHRNFSLGLARPGESLSPVSHLHLNTRIGLSSGPIVVGNIGSALRMDYTAIGDDVILASRLEGANKIYKTRVVIARSTYELVRDAFVCRELDRLRLKGKKEPTSVYELVAERGTEAPGRFDWIEQYQAALSFYRRGEWHKAVDLFRELAEGPLQDPPSKVMLDRCIDLANNPPETWSGVLPAGG